MTDTITKYLSEVKAREDAATKGPWHNIAIMQERGLGYVCGPGAEKLVADNGCFFKQSDAQFAAAARTDIPLLRTALERAVAELRDLAEPCTRQDYTFAKLDQVVMKLSREALAEIERLIREAGGN